MTKGRITTPGAIVENLGKNCKIEIPKKNLGFLIGRRSETDWVKENAHVGYTPELLQHIARQECDNGILGGDDLVSWIDMLGHNLSLVIKEVSWDVFVNQDCPRWTRLPVA
jgi:hypothetical protein